MLAPHRALGFSSVMGAIRRNSIVFSNTRVIAVFNLPLAVAAGWLLWRSLSWPLIGDATIFHFISAQMAMGAVPYRDIADVNMPLVYGIDAAVVALGGMGDAPWRAFDLIAFAVLSILMLILLAPAGAAAAILAVLIMLVTHLLLGPYAAGQRDYLMLIPMLAAAVAAARLAEADKRRWLYLVLGGAFAMTAALVKPTGILLLALPLVAAKVRWRELVWSAAGALIVAVLVFGTLAYQGGLAAFITMTRDLLPLYAAMKAQPLFTTLEAIKWLVPMAGLALAIVLAPLAVRIPRVRIMIALTVFGLIHLLVQRKGWSYHIYPLAAGLACLGAWSLATLPRRRFALSLMTAALALAWAVVNSVSTVENYEPLQATSAMQSALERSLPRGSRVQVLDADAGAFLAMARAGMRQATPHIQWFSLLLAEDPVRAAFLSSLAADPPAAFLLTNEQWPKERGFEAADDWPEFRSFLTSQYDLAFTGHEDYIDWRLYIRRAQASGEPAR